MTSLRMLRQSFDLLRGSGVYPENTPLDWIKSLVYLHKKGWLYVRIADKENIDFVAAAYRIKRFNKKEVKIYPKKEEGKILFIPFLASKVEDPMFARKILSSFLKGKDIQELIFYDMKDGDKLKRFKRIKTKQEVKNGKKRKIANTT